MLVDPPVDSKRPLQAVHPPISCMKHIKGCNDCNPSAHILPSSINRGEADTAAANHGQRCRLLDASAARHGFCSRHRGHHLIGARPVAAELGLLLEDVPHRGADRADGDGVRGEGQSPQCSFHHPPSFP